MKTAVVCAVVMTALAAQQASAAFRNSCFGGRCGFQSGNNGFQGFQPRFNRNQYQNQFQGSNFNPRFGAARSPFGPSPNRFRQSPSGFSSSASSNRFSSSASANRFSSPSSHFSSGRSQFGPGQRQFSSSSSSSHFSSPSGSFGRFNRFGPRQSTFQSRFSSVTPEQRYQAQVATRRQLSDRRRHEQHLVQSRTGLVQPGTPSAALAAEKRADSKSLALGNQALQQILFLQNLVGAGRRRR